MGGRRTLLIAHELRQDARRRSPRALEAAPRLATALGAIMVKVGLWRWRQNAAGEGAAEGGAGPGGSPERARGRRRGRGAVEAMKQANVAANRVAHTQHVKEEALVQSRGARLQLLQKRAGGWAEWAVQARGGARGGRAWSIEAPTKPQSSRSSACI